MCELNMNEGNNRGLGYSLQQQICCPSHVHPFLVFNQIVTHLLCALDLRWLMWVVGVDGECESERAALVHSCAWEIVRAML